jgi:hypothetical protein
VTFIFDETRELHPMRECLNKTIVGTGNSATNVSLTFGDGMVLLFTLRDGDVHVAVEERP